MLTQDEPDMKTHQLSLLALCCLLCWTPWVKGQVNEQIKREKLVRNGVYLRVHQPVSETSKLPAIMVLGGSEGGYGMWPHEADSLVMQGFLVARIAYFKLKDTDLPKTLENIPLEYFERALDEVMNLPQVDTSRLGLLAISKGTEPALYLATTSSHIKALAAHVPSHVFWYGLTSWKGSKAPSWTQNGAPVPFVPLAKPESGWFTRNIHEFYEAGLAAHPEKEAEARIPVEQMRCHLLLSSGKEDRMWPSAYMAEQIVNRLEAEGYPYELTHLAFDQAGHGIFGYLQPGEKTKFLTKLGGTEEGNLNALEKNWTETLAFFKRHLQVGQEWGNP